MFFFKGVTIIFCRCCSGTVSREPVAITELNLQSMEAGATGRDGVTAQLIVMLASNVGPGSAIIRGKITVDTQVSSFVLRVIQLLSTS